MADSRTSTIVDPGASWSGITVIAGASGSGKSYLALAASIEAARSGSIVHYITTDMPARIVAQRAGAYSGGRPPESWRIVELRPGADLSTLAELVELEPPQLLVVDTAQGLLEEGGTPLRELIRWARSVRRETRGRVSFVLVHEGCGRRFAWADRVLHMANDRRRSRLKYMHDDSGHVRALLNLSTARLAFIGTVRARDGGCIDA